ncbi:hypothetical protein HHI36_017519 [Cryptolaemus montrouzieri]|uniref:Uncharacterized protein n=1 Tax=Cryptolaemus montrouzieri TaxID=559131 RepID=A0ABD2NML7_9CUCU
MYRIELEEVRNEKQESLILLSKRSSVSSPRHLAHSSTLKDIKTLEDLNESVDHLLERSSEDAEVCQQIASKIQQFNKDFSKVEKNLEELYEQSLQEKQLTDEKITKLETENSELERNIRTLETKLEIFNQDGTINDSLKKIADLSGENVGANLKRGFLEVECRKLQEKNDFLAADLLRIETEHTKNLAEWSRNDKALRSKIKILENDLERAVSFEEFRKVKKELENLTVKFRELMEDYKRQNDNNQTELDLTKRSKQMCDAEKLELKNRLNECLSKIHSCQGIESSDEKIQDLSKHLSECEVNVIGEKQRADHINNLYELVKDQLNKSEERFKEYENYTKDIMHKNLILQGQLKEVEDKLCEFVDVDLYNAVKEELKGALGQIDDLSAQVGKLQEEKLVSTVYSDLQRVLLACSDHSDQKGDGTFEKRVGRVEVWFIQHQGVDEESRGVVGET